MKRVRTDGQVTKDFYEQQEDETETSSEFTRATADVLSSRKMVVGIRQPDKRQQFATHVETLNISFFEWFSEQISQNPSYDLTDGFQDYIDYSTTLEDRFLRSYGEVLTFGSGDCGQLAHGTEKDEDLSVKFPRVVYSLRDKNVYGIACGGIHTAVYTDSGRVYTWGCADDGALGREGDESLPLLVEHGLQDETIIGVDCGDCHTTVVSIKGEVWGWGCYKDREGKAFFNPEAQSPNPAKTVKRQQKTPIKITGVSNAVEVACGATFSVVRTSEGCLYSWGIGESGELSRYTPPLKVGANEDEMTYDLPSVLKHHITPSPMCFASPGEDYKSLPKSDVGRRIVSDVKSFGCGSYHSMVVVVGDIVYACGLNNYGQLGVADTRNPRWYMTEVPSLGGRGIVQIKGGVHHSLCLSSSGSILAWGRGDSGQLGIKKFSQGAAGEFSEEPITPDLPRDVEGASIACGGNHNLILTTKNELYSWGYGDMLALGHGLEQDEPTPKRVNFSKAGIKNITISQVAGGGQHSAIVGQVVGLA